MYIRAAAQVCHEIWEVTDSDQSGQAIKLFQPLEKLVSPPIFGHKSFILDDVKLTYLSNNSFE